MRAAVIDVGSNSVRLLLMEGMTPWGAVGERRVTVTGLRRGAHADGSVASAAITRLDACLADYAERIAAAGGPPVVAVGTSAVREAPNRAAILAVVLRRLGCDLRVVTGREEGALAFAGARLVMSGASGTCTVVEIGGGSTEVVQGGDAGPEHAVSLPLGVNRQGEHLTGDPPPPERVDAIAADAAAMVGAATQAFGRTGMVIGVAGTVTTTAAIQMGRYDPDRIHGMVITRADVADVLGRVSAVDGRERSRIPGLHPDRVNSIVPGLAILLGSLRALGADDLVVSERDLLDGVAMEWAHAGAGPSH